MFKILTLPFSEKASTFDEEILNGFLLNKKLIAYKAEFFVYQGKPFWTVFLEYDPILAKELAVKKEDLSGPEKVLFEKLRAWRKERADKEGIPPYVLATNTEIVSVIKRKPDTMEELKTVKGFGVRKIEQYGEDIVKIIKQFFETE